MSDWDRVFPVTVGDSVLEFVADSGSQLTLRLLTFEGGQIAGFQEQPVDIGSFEREHPHEFKQRIVRNVELFEERRATGEQTFWPPTPEMLVADLIDFVPLSSRGTVDALVRHLREVARSGSSGPQHAILHWPEAARHLYWLSVWLETAENLLHQGTADLDTLEEIYAALEATGCTAARKASHTAQSAYVSTSLAEPRGAPSEGVPVHGDEGAQAEVRSAIERLIETNADTFYE